MTPDLDEIRKPTLTLAVKTACGSDCTYPNCHPLAVTNCMVTKEHVQRLSAAGLIQEWREIESAPRDGTRLDAWGTCDESRQNGYERYTNAHWSVGHKEWVKKYPGSTVILYPTHYMLPPTPPADGAENG